MKILKPYFILVLFLLGGCSGKENGDTTSDSVAVMPSDSLEADTVTGGLKLHEKSKSFNPIFIPTSILDYSVNGSPDVLQQVFKPTNEELEKNGVVYLERKHFAGDNVPFVCYASKNIKSFFINGKKIPFTPESEFFFRQSINLYTGYNRIPVKIINKAGYKTESYFEINMVQTSN